ncbi:MAG: hypothetical protein FWD50_02570 [Betaproteobacteria bacterium]|nr:hypothetical protein [Betaproteobacteria bacterium]
MNDSIVTLDELAGEYNGGRGPGLTARLIVRADGRFDWKRAYFYPGSDAGIPFAASGRLVPDGAGAFAVHLDPDTHYPPGSLPPRLHAVRTSKFIVLLADGSVNAIINMINGGGQLPRTTNLSGFLHRLLPGATERDAKSINRMLLVPKRFANRILPAPLQGKVLSVEEISVTKTNISEPMMEPVWQMVHLSRLMVDLGSQQGVFEGMELYVGESQRRMEGTVKRVMADRCEMHFEWADGYGPPKVGDPVSSRYGAF